MNGKIYFKNNKNCTESVTVKEIALTYREENLKAVGKIQEQQWFSGHTFIFAIVF